MRYKRIIFIMLFVLCGCNKRDLSKDLIMDISIFPSKTFTMESTKLILCTYKTLPIFNYKESVYNLNSPNIESSYVYHLENNKIRDVIKIDPKISNINAFLIDQEGMIDKKNIILFQDKKHLLPVSITIQIRYNKIYISKAKKYEY